MQHDKFAPYRKMSAPHNNLSEVKCFVSFEAPKEILVEKKIISIESKSVQMGTDED